MIKSMTGFGRAEGTVNDRTYVVEIRSLNGKVLDLNLRIPSLIKTYEFEIRKMIKQELIRGYVECSISIKQDGSSHPVLINTELIKAYYKQMDEAASELAISSDGVFAALLRLPEVVTPSNEIADEAEWMGLKGIITTALRDINEHRKAEGEVLGKELKKIIEKIELHEDEVDRLAPERSEKIRADLKRLLEDNLGDENLDEGRLEREMIYYIEKIDIREEQVRLRTHCKYFKEILDNHEDSNGKKLAFILQEIGREINTTGSKAYNSDIQKAVVMMKDELEKAKEQTFNVL